MDPDRARSAPSPAPTVGLTITGTVVGRKRRTINAENSGKDLVIITYHILGGDAIYPVETVNPQDIYALDTFVILPVTIRCFVTRKGTAMYSFSVKGGEDGTF